MPPPEVTGFSYDKIKMILSWNSLGDDVEYEIEYKANASPDFSPLYIGNNTYKNVDLQPGTYSLKGRGKSSGGGLGLWTDPPEVIIVN